MQVGEWAGKNEGKTGRRAGLEKDCRQVLAMACLCPGACILCGVWPQLSHHRCQPQHALKVWKVDLPAGQVLNWGVTHVLACR